MLPLKGAIMPAMRAWLDRLPVWQWAVVMACSGFLGVAGAAVFIGLTGHHIDIRWFAEYGAFYAICLGGFSALTHHLRTRRRRERGPHTGQMPR
jgi:hypothetical protein